MASAWHMVVKNGFGVASGGLLWSKAGQRTARRAGRLGGGGAEHGFAPPETCAIGSGLGVEQARGGPGIGRLVMELGGGGCRAGVGGLGGVVVRIGVGAAGVLERPELGEGLLELPGEVALVADEVIDPGGLGEDALAAEIGELAGVGAEGGAGGVDGVADG